jgi:putative transposase
VKLLWLAITNIEDKRARERAKAAGKAKANAPGHLVEGAATQGWRAALGALLIAFPDRIAAHIN